MAGGYLRNNFAVRNDFFESSILCPPEIVAGRGGRRRLICAE